MRKTGNGYFGLDFIVSLVLAIFPITNLLFGIFTRLENKSYLMVVLNVLLAPLFYIIDLYSIIVKKELVYLV
jgi:hypothetical protein